MINLLLLILTLLVSSRTFALSTDKDQDIEILADTAELDEKEGVTIYRGNVIVTQGSIKMTGNEMTVYFTEDDDLDRVILLGTPATYRQLPDNSTVYDEAEALRMEYHEQQAKIILIDKALVIQEDLRFSGKRIDYDTENSRVIAKSQTSPSDTEKKERVKIIIKPKKKQ